jgi:septal ring factor EnvC (AmiA/AmiB activator)
MAPRNRPRPASSKPAKEPPPVPPADTLTLQRVHDYFAHLNASYVALQRELDEEKRVIEEQARAFAERSAAQTRAHAERAASFDTEMRRRKQELEQLKQEIAALEERSGRDGRSDHDA